MILDAPRDRRAVLPGSSRWGHFRRLPLIAIVGLATIGCQAMGQPTPSIEAATATPSRSATPAAPTATPRQSLTPTIPPSAGNDDPPGITINSLPFTHATDASQAQIHHLERGPLCANPPSSSQSVWYAFIPDVDITVVAETGGSDYDTIVDVFAGALSPDILDPYYFEEFDQLDPIACNDNNGGSIQSQVVFAAAAGQNYVLRVTTAPNAQGGSLVFTLAAS